MTSKELPGAGRKIDALDASPPFFNKSSTTDLIDPQTNDAIASMSGTTGSAGLEPLTFHDGHDRKQDYPEEIELTVDGHEILKNLYRQNLSPEVYDIAVGISQALTKGDLREIFEPFDETEPNQILDELCNIVGRGQSDRRALTRAVEAVNQAFEAEHIHLSLSSIFGHIHLPNNVVIMPDGSYYEVKPVPPPQADLYVPEPRSRK